MGNGGYVAANSRTAPASTDKFMIFPEFWMCALNWIWKMSLSHFHYFLNMWYVDKSIDLKNHPLFVVTNWLLAQKDLIPYLLPIFLYLFNLITYIHLFFYEWIIPE
jgi:hypothetical protein